jgi:hypothetical protein
LDLYRYIPNVIEKELEMESSQDPERSNYLMAFVAGFGTTIIIALAYTGISILFKAEYQIILCCGSILVGVTVANFVKHRSIGGAIIGAILGASSYVIYKFILTILGWGYADEASAEFTFNMWVIVSALAGAWVGYNKED